MRHAMYRGLGEFSALFSVPNLEEYELSCLLADFYALDSHCPNYLAGHLHYPPALFSLFFPFFFPHFLSYHTADQAPFPLESEKLEQNGGREIFEKGEEDEMGVLCSLFVFIVSRWLMGYGSRMYGHAVRVLKIFGFTVCVCACLALFVPSSMHCLRV